MINVGQRVQIFREAFSGQVGVVSEVHGSVIVINFKGPRLWGGGCFPVSELWWFGAKVERDGEWQKITLSDEGADP